MRDQRDFLDEAIAQSMNDDPVFAEAWTKNEFALSLVKLRVDQGKTQQQVADLIGVRREWVAELERNPARVSLQRIWKYVSALGGTLLIASTESVPTLVPPAQKTRGRRPGSSRIKSA